jgi:hypothetical protein
VVYRLLHQVLVVVVSRAHGNVFSSLNLVAAISRLLVAEAKSIELTPERLLKKYAQVWYTAGCCAAVAGLFAFALALVNRKGKGL